MVIDFNDCHVNSDDGAWSRHKLFWKYKQLFMLSIQWLWQKDEGIKLVTEAICAGIFNDLGSGSNVDVCVITKVC